MKLAEFEAKVHEYLTNTESAFMGYMPITTHEREDLLRLWRLLAPEDQKKALELLGANKVDVRGWA